MRTGAARQWATGPLLDHPPPRNARKAVDSMPQVHNSELAAATPRGPEEHKRLARELGLRTEDLFVGAKQTDPYFCGMPSQHRDAEWFMSVWERCGYTHPVHLRRLFYRALSLDPKTQITDYDRVGRPLRTRELVNTEHDWNRLLKAASASRWLGHIDPKLILDARTDPPSIGVVARDYEPEPEIDADLWQPELPRPSLDLPSAPTLEVPDVVVDGYDYQPADQPYVVEVWIEKSTMNDVLEPVCEGLGVNLVHGVGFMSITTTRKLVERAARYGKPVRVFYIADHDPAGDNMTVAVARAAQFMAEQWFPNADLAITQLALTEEQVAAYRLPGEPVPIGAGKGFHKAAASFVERYGDRKTELDALEAVHPGELARMVRAAIAPYRDANLRDRLADARSDAAEQANQQWQEQTAGLREELEQVAADAGRVYDAFRPRFETLLAELERRLVPHDARLADIWERVEKAWDGFEPELPERPTPAVDEPDESSWLFDSRRHWWAQLQKFKAWQRRAQ
jgi:hypothetical protein